MIALPADVHGPDAQACGQHGWHAAAALSDRDGAFKQTPVPASPHERGNGSAKLMLVALSLAWGVNWPALRIALRELPPFGMRTVSLGLGALLLLAAVAAQRRRLSLDRPVDWLHVLIASALNIVGLSLLSSFALLTSATSRVTILAYTMPIWAALLTPIALGERLSRTTLVALALCVAGMAVLIWPLAHDGVPLGLMLAVATGMSWAAGTVYIKWARIRGDPIAITAWQLTLGSVIVAVALPFVEGVPHVANLHAATWLATIFTAIIGSGLAYFLWFNIVGRLPAMTASLGVLSVPLIGVVATALILGEYPTVPDVVGFVLIFAAAACVLLSSREAAPPEPS